MIVWVVTWTVMVNVPCPLPPPDPYTGQITNIPTIACTAKKRMNKEFKSKTEAQKFVDEAPDGIFYHPYEFKIEEETRP